MSLRAVLGAHETTRSLATLASAAACLAEHEVDHFAALCEHQPASAIAAALRAVRPAGINSTGALLPYLVGGRREDFALQIGGAVSLVVGVLSMMQQQAAGVPLKGAGAGGVLRSAPDQVRQVVMRPAVGTAAFESQLAAFMAALQAVPATALYACAGLNPHDQRALDVGITQAKGAMRDPAGTVPVSAIGPETPEERARRALEPALRSMGVPVDVE